MLVALVMIYGEVLESSQFVPVLMTAADIVNLVFHQSLANFLHSRNHERSSVVAEEH